MSTTSTIHATRDARIRSRTSRIRRPPLPHAAAVPISASEALVWRSPQSGALLLDGKPMTHRRAVFACLTHSRNQIDPDQSTPTRITYREIDGTVGTYEGTRPTGRTPAASPRQHQSPGGAVWTPAFLS